VAAKFNIFRVATYSKEDVAHIDLQTATESLGGKLAWKVLTNAGTLNVRRIGAEIWRTRRAQDLEHEQIVLYEDWLDHKPFAEYKALDAEQKHNFWRAHWYYLDNFCRD